MPGKLNARVLSHVSLSIGAANNVSSCEVPLTSALWHIVVECAFKVASVAVLPFALDHLSLLVAANKLLIGLTKDVGALALLLAVSPFTGVYVLVCVVHNTLTMTLAIFPVAIVSANITVGLLANAALQVVAPFAAISVCLLFTAWCNSVSVNALSVTELK